MEHMILGPCEEIVHHLIRFCFLDFPMLLFANGFHESLVDELTHGTPGRPVLHHQDMVSTSDQIGDERLWPAAVECAFLVQQIFDVLPVADHKRSVLEPFQGKDASIFLGPCRHADRSPLASHGDPE